MITPGYIRTMADYNSEMNRRLYMAAATLDDPARLAPRGLFWGSLHGTLCHLLWADRMWMSRFDGWARPPVTLRESAHLVADFDHLLHARAADDGRISAWADGVTEAWLAEDLTWTSGASGRERSAPRPLLVAHMFNHQTHHRGQAHAALTQAGVDPGDTDLFFVVDAMRQ